MPHDYTESLLVEGPAVELLAELGWQTANATFESFGTAGTLQRETPGEVVLFGRLRDALRRLNPSLPDAAIATAIDHLTVDRSSMSRAAANREVYALLKGGVLVSLPDPIHGGQKQERVRIIDWENPANNDFLAVRQLKITGQHYNCIPDLIGYVNGLPLVVMEFKKPGVAARQAFEENLTSYKHAKNGVPHLFPYNALLIASNGTESRVGSLTADWERFFEWKRVEREDEPRAVSLEKILRGTCDPARLLDLVENFTLFSEEGAKLFKVVGQNHQYLGVNNAIQASLVARRQGHGRGGVFWQTQGSGKSYSMVFYSQKIFRKIPGNWTFVIVTDRTELDDQIARTFKAVGAVTEADGDRCHAQSGAELRTLLRENHRYVFTLIHKFQTGEQLTDRRDVVVLVDEAHRSQYDTLALNMRAAMPNATFVAFTGTPLIAGEERTREVFGDYVSIYDFQQSVEDGATVPLFYENRTPELQLVNPNLNEDLYNVIEDANLDEAAESRLATLLGQQYHLLTRDDRLETVAKDLVQHFLGRGFQGKAMVVSIDKATALRMYDKVRVHWAEEEARVRADLLRYGLTPEAEAELRARLDVLITTDMAVVVSPGQNEVEQMRALKLDILPHRKRMNDEKLDEKFKDTADPLRLVFVCAMWLTGFDAPSCSTIYLDKPMRNHTLMQTIARANRVYPGKHSGVIVDYANVFLSLERALAIYAQGGGGHTPVRDKAQLARDLEDSLAAATAFCLTHDVDLAAIENLPSGSMARLSAVGLAVNALISPDDTRKGFFAHERLVRQLYNAVKPDPVALKSASRVACIGTIGDEIRLRTNPHPMDLSNVLASISQVLDQSIAGVDIAVGEGTKVDLSKIDFETLRKKFSRSKQKNTEIEALKAAIEAQLNGLIVLNWTRIDFRDKFEALIEAYNAGAANIEVLFEELVKLAQSLSEEQQRHIRENVSEEELVIFDILTRPAPELSAEEREELKQVARHMLTRIKALLVLDWRTRRASIARVQQLIGEALDDGLPPAYTPDLYKTKCDAVFQHLYEKYPQAGTGVYAQSA